MTNPPPPPVSPVIIGEKAIFQRKMKKGKPVGPAVLTGFTLTFNTSLNQSTATNRGNYQLATVTTKKVKKKTTTILHPIAGFIVSYITATDTVDVNLIGTQTFPTGGGLTIVSTPSRGVTSTSGLPISGKTTFAISKNGKTITQKGVRNLFSPDRTLLLLLDPPCAILPCPSRQVGYNVCSRNVSAFVARGKGVRVGYFDCFSGTAGDMTMAALVDAGVDRRAIQQGVASLGLPCELTFENVRRGGFRATYAKVIAPEEHVHRHWHHIEAMIDKSSLTARQKDLAKRIFLKLGEAEASVHGVDLSKIHFHEVGAVDSIADIVGSAIGLDLLGVDRYEASPVPTGRGWVKAAHGRMPLPAPATAELLRGVPLAESFIDGEMTTPTGAAILATVVERFAPLPGA